MSIFTSVGVENLQLRNGSTGFNKLDRFFNTIAEADAAVAGGSYTPDPTVTNGVLIADVGLQFITLTPILLILLHSIS